MKLVLTCLPLLLGMGWFGYAGAPEDAAALATPAVAAEFSCPDDASECALRVEPTGAGTCLLICEGPGGQRCEVEISCDDVCPGPCPLPCEERPVNCPNSTR